ncbi:MAG TPA: MATE family efflux transporter, partial [Acidilobales archaeon]|nr:MATE family efflux transporter [Acidilobales archaeon]
MAGNRDELRERILGGSIISTILWLAWPIVLANIVNISYNLVDAFWLGKIGKEAFGAPTVSWPLIMLFHSLGMGFSGAGIALISQYVGSNNFEMANKSASQLVSFMLIMSSIIAIGGYISSPTILALMGVPHDVYPLAVSYIRIIFMGMPIVFMGFTFITIANSLGDTRTPTVLNIASSIANMILDPILIFGLFGLPPLGVVGAAIATVISRSIISIVGTYLLLHGFRGIRLDYRYFRLEGWWICKVSSIGAPLAIQRSSTALGFTIMMSIVSRFGSSALAAYGVSIRVIDVLQAFTWGINRATSIMVGQNLGAKLYERARRVANVSTLLTILTLTAGSLIILLMRDWVIKVFIDNPEVVAEGVRLLTIFTPSIPFFGLFFMGGGIATGSGHTRFFALVSVIRLWVLRIGLSILLALILNLGTIGIWIAMTLSNIGAGTLSL